VHAAHIVGIGPILRRALVNARAECRRSSRTGLEATLVRKHVNHPREYLREEGAAFSLAGFLGMDGAEHAKLRVLAKYSFTLFAGAPQKFVCLCQRAMLSGTAGSVRLPWRSGGP